MKPIDKSIEEKNEVGACVKLYDIAKIFADIPWLYGPAVRRVRRNLFGFQKRGKKETVVKMRGQKA